MTSFYAFLERPFWQQILVSFVFLSGMSVTFYLIFLAPIAKNTHIQQMQRTSLVQKIAQLEDKLQAYLTLEQLTEEYQSLLSNPKSTGIVPTNIGSTLTALIKQTQCSLHQITFHPRTAQNPAHWSLDVTGNFAQFSQLVNRIHAQFPALPVTQLAIFPDNNQLHLHLNIDVPSGNKQ